MNTAKGTCNSHCQSESPESTVTEESERRELPHHAAVGEAELFPPAVEPALFGTGSYRTGGSNAEGNYRMGELNPRGGYGTFSDAGGPGSTVLYGEGTSKSDAHPSDSAPVSSPDVVKKESR